MTRACQCGRSNLAEAAVSPGELLQRGVECMGIEVWPVALRKVQFGIGALEQQKITETLLPTGTNQQID